MADTSDLFQAVPDLMGPNQRQSSQPQPSQTPQQPPALADVRDYIRNLDTSKIFQEMTENPNAVQDVVNRALSGLTPEMLQQASNIQNTPTGNKFLIEQAAKNEVQQAKQAQRGLRVQFNEDNTTRLRNSQAAQRQLNQERQRRQAGLKYKQIVHMGPKRKLADQKLIVGQDEAEALKILKAKSVGQVPCPKLGPTIRVWYMPDFNVKFKHPRASKILGFDVGGEFLFFDTEGDLDVAKFLSLEKQLGNDTNAENELTALAALVEAEL